MMAGPINRAASNSVAGSARMMPAFACAPSDRITELGFV